jgi:hypothetical protein
MLAAEFRQRVVGHARELGRRLGPRNQLERWIGEREHLLQPVEFVEEGKPGVDVPQRLEPGERGERHVAGNKRAEPIEIGPRHEMIEDVDHHFIHAW